MRTKRRAAYNAGMALISVRAAKALRRGRLSDAFTSSLASFAPYRGCGHACAYCDGRAERYYVEGDFGSDISCRDNLVELLRAELPLFRERDSAGRRPLICVGSGVTDSYQPAEARRGLTRKAAEILLEARRPALLMTKSSLVVRDLDLWAELNRVAGFTLLFSITGVDESAREVFEPGASPYAERFSTIKAFSEAGCATGVLAMPLLPGVSDDRDSVAALYAAAKDSGADFVFPGGLTLRPGRQKDHFMAALDGARPELVASYRDAYGENRPSGAPRRGSTKALDLAVREATSATGLPARLPHRRLRRFVPGYEALHLLYCQMRELYAELGVDTSSLRDAAGRFSGWLESRRSTLNRRRSLPDTWIESEFAELLGGRGFEELLGNSKLAAFSRRVVEDGAEFDYGTLNIDYA